MLSLNTQNDVLYKSYILMAARLTMQGSDVLIPLFTDTVAPRYCDNNYIIMAAHERALVIVFECGAHMPDAPRGPPRAPLESANGTSLSAATAPTTR